MLDEVLRHPAITRENALPLSSAAEGVSQSVCNCMSLLILHCGSASLSPKRLNTAEEFYLNPASALWGHSLLLELPSVFKTHKSRLGWAERCEDCLLEECLYLLCHYFFPPKETFRPVLVSHTLDHSWSLPPAGRNALDLSWRCQSLILIMNTQSSLLQSCWFLSVGSHIENQLMDMNTVLFCFYYGPVVNAIGIYATSTATFRGFTFSFPTLPCLLIFFF